MIVPLVFVHQGPVQQVVSIVKDKLGIFESVESVSKDSSKRKTSDEKNRVGSKSIVLIVVKLQSIYEIDQFFRLLSTCISM